MAITSHPLAGHPACVDTRQLCSQLRGGLLTLRGHPVICTRVRVPLPLSETLGACLVAATRADTGGAPAERDDDVPVMMFCQPCGDPHTVVISQPPGHPPEKQKKKKE